LKGDHDESRRIVRSDIDQGHVVFPVAGSTDEDDHFGFNFVEVIGMMMKTPMIDSQMPFTRTILAALHGHLRTVMWKMCLDPEGLLRLVRPQSPHGFFFPGANPDTGGLRRLDPELSTITRARSLSLAPSASPSDISRSPSRVPPSQSDLWSGSHDRYSMQGQHSNDSPAPRHSNALLAAIRGGHLDVIAQLLDNGADVNSRCTSFDSPLAVASSKGDKDIVQLLIDRGADVNALCPGHDSALCTAPVNGSESGVYWQRYV
jgi:hypothetical protein